MCVARRASLQSAYGLPAKPNVTTVDSVKTLRAGAAFLDAEEIEPEVEGSTRRADLWSLEDVVCGAAEMPVCTLGKLLGEPGEGDEGCFVFLKPSDDADEHPCAPPARVPPAGLHAARAAQNAARARPHAPRPAREGTRSGARAP